MKAKSIILSIIITAIFILNSCSKDEKSIPIIKKEHISGFVQKGPFINGTSISINELNADLSQTGKMYNTQITDNKGSFEIGNIELVSNYISLRADGFYFNEILGEQSTSQITLYALSDISDKTTVNTNVLSHLEKPRVEYLESQGVVFSEAKSQAQSEILDIFNISTPLTESSEVLDISQDGDNNAILLATSLILQGYRTEAEVTELLSNISTDIREDGALTNNSIGSQLINHAIYLDTTSIRNNLVDRYSDLGVNAEIPYFEKYIRNFIDSTTFEITENLIEYPTTGLYGENILDLEKESYNGENFSLAADLAMGTELKIKITALGTGFWFFTDDSSTNWLITQFDDVTKSQYFTAIDSDKSCDLNIQFNSGTFLIEYFEMGVSEPNRTKIITI
ncbi:MAG: hypothetical protein KJ578_00120 [Bacteroidetes bacterium]|nr:hypothetical protein [Bacteroidota bacterium]MBU1578634.1 hypothetical protein [Bacteroidota bacterium]MBU2556164.1 hypothetical protein [Bacteroidota bacterium]